MITRRACLIVNPSAGRGRALKDLASITRAFAAHGIVDVRLTELPGDEIRLANGAMDHGIETIVAVGGDGTVAQISHAIVARRSGCRLGLVPVGTGNDFAKTIGALGLGFKALAALCAGQSVATVDVCRVDDWYFLNTCGFGIDPAVLAATRNVRWLRGNAVYIWATLGKLFSYGGIKVDVAGSTLKSAVPNPLMMLVVSNGPNLGGAFKIAPGASVCDGLFDVHYFGDARPARRFRLFVAALRGTHAKLPEVKFERRSSLVLRFAEPPEMEIDGELRTANGTEVAITCLAGALNVVAAPGYPI